MTYIYFFICLISYVVYNLGSLQIKSSEEMDQGNYECVAENAKGTVYSYAAKLFVRGKK